ncbi:hypothetical protein NIES4074_57560 [Cylindrospermum sp. NIES-4074]|nr:hypothetical protein NIES4074_57560 [Cylindrospermum sp. NIES-4074]
MTVSLGSGTASATATTFKVAVVAPGAMVKVLALTAVIFSPAARLYSLGMAVEPVVLKLTTNPPTGAAVSRVMVNVPVVPPSTGVMPEVIVTFGVLFSSTVTLSSLMFATAKSDLPSPLKSPTVTDSGSSPTPKLVGASKPVLSALRSSTETSLLS